MNERLVWIRTWFEARSVRERLILTAALAAGLVLVFEAISWAPERKRLQAAEIQIASLKQQSDALQHELDVLDQQEALDPDAAVRRQLDAFNQQADTLDGKLRAKAIQLLTPDQARTMLHDLIASARGLKLVGLQTRPPTPLVETEGLDLPVLYRHGLVIDLQGDYLALLAYVQALEQLPWRIYWYGLEVQADAPGARSFRLNLYTISLHKEWIRV